MTTLVQLINLYVTRTDKRAAQRLKRVSERAAEDNSGMEPTIDRFGRMHAPCDGYHWEERIFPAGAYLPLPADVWEYLFEMGVQYKNFSGVGICKSRVKTTVSGADEITEACSGYAKTSKGRVWDDNETCYLYIETKYKGLNELIENYNKEKDEELRLEKERLAEERRKNKGVAPEGRVKVKGKVLHVKEDVQDEYYGIVVTYKVLVELDNKATVYGTLPKALLSAETGDEVEFTATFTQAEGDQTHAFYKRPSKASFTQGAQ